MLLVLQASLPNLFYFIIDSYAGLICLDGVIELLISNK
jgi:hypothetical protein